MSKPWKNLYPPGIPIEVDIPSGVSIHQSLALAASRFPASVAIIDKDLQLTYDELITAVDRLAVLFHSKGMKKGDHIAVMLPNSAEYIITYFAMQRLGCVQVQVNILYQKNELTHILNDSRSEWIITNPEGAEKLDRLKLQKNPDRLVFDDERKLFNEICFNGDGVEAGPPGVEIDPSEDVAIIQYTGGTTGFSKGAMLTHANITANVVQNAAFYALKENEVTTLGNTPMAHVMGLSYINITFLLGGTYIVVRRFSIPKAKELLQKYSPTIFIGAPTIYIGILNSDEISSEDLQSLQVCTCGTAPLPIEVIREFEKLSGAYILEGYGMTEVLVTHRNPMSELKKPGSIGVPLPNTDCKVVDPTDGMTELPTGETGEVIIKGPQVMKGYWRNKEENNRSIRDGWMYTGDLGVMDEQGYFYIVGRKKDLIIASGYNIYPIEVENVIYEHPAILEACIVGVPDEYRGETVKCVAVLKDGFSLTESDLVAFCKERLATYKVPKIIEFRDFLPKTAVGKIQRLKLKDEAVVR